MEQEKIHTKPSSNQSDERLKRFISFVAVTVFALAAGFTGSWIQSSANGDGESTHTTAIMNNAKTDGNAIVTTNEESIAGVARSVGPSVVSILTSKGSSYSGEQGAGTGMIASSNGYILTNKHVVSGVDKVTVVLQSGK